MIFRWLAAARDWFVGLPWPTWGEFAELLKALSSLLWPVVILIFILIFKDDVRRLFSGRRVKRGKLFGQEFELEEALDRLEEAANTLPETAPSPSVHQQPLATPGEGSVGERSESQEVPHEVLAIAATSPKAALMLLAAEIESELRNLLESRGIDVRPRASVLDMLRGLEEAAGFPTDAKQVMSRFRDVRNRIIHGQQADPDDVLRAIDIGIKLQSMLRAWRNTPVADTSPRAQGGSTAQG